MGTIVFHDFNESDLFVIFSNNLSIQGTRGLNEKSIIFNDSSDLNKIQQMSDDFIPKVINLLINIVYSKHLPNEKPLHLDVTKTSVNNDNREHYTKLMTELSKVIFTNRNKKIHEKSQEKIISAYQTIIKVTTTQGGGRKTLRQNILNFRRKTLKKKLSKKRKKNKSRKNKSRKNKSRKNKSRKNK